MAHGYKSGGRSKGTPNKITNDMRRVFQDLIENNIDQLQELFDRTAKENPAKALELYLRLSEFVIPKAKADIDIDNEIEVILVN